jgi:outer membrane protein assembly factor BamB
VFAIGLPDAGGNPEILWNYRKNVPSIPSPLVYDDVFYMVKDGVVTSLDPNTGELLKRDRLAKKKSKVYASPVAADGKIYIGNMDGWMVVLEAGPEWKVLTSNDLGDEIWASPAIADGHIYVRTKTKIYDFSSRAKIAKESRRSGRRSDEQRRPAVSSPGWQ